MAGFIDSIGSTKSVNSLLSNNSPSYWNNETLGNLEKQLYDEESKEKRKSKPKSKSKSKSTPKKDCETELQKLRKDNEKWFNLYTNENIERQLLQNKNHTLNLDYMKLKSINERLKKDINKYKNNTNYNLRGRKRSKLKNKKKTKCYKKTKKNMICIKGSKKSMKKIAKYSRKNKIKLTKCSRKRINRINKIKKA